MEVAGQWRREWAGTAEYGKVTEGGVTRRVARAVEVLAASGPGAHVQVMRAAYHESAGPGTPAASYLMHSSRRVISSGFKRLEPQQSLPIKPLEISSQPLESSPERYSDSEEYKVTEPDDYDISEATKWKNSKLFNNSIRILSEESSSVGTESIVDCNPLQNRNLRKYSHDSDSSEISQKKTGYKGPHLLDPPVTLSTLKYKSLLNGNNEWNNRRKSYSFEDSAPMSEMKNEKLISSDFHNMESSTDSGICKSTEVVNDTSDNFYVKLEKNEEETFKDWLQKNRAQGLYNSRSRNKSNKEHDVLLEEPRKSFTKGTFVVAVPLTVEADFRMNKFETTEENDRKSKKVEFSKTELHFGIDKGTVDIIATDEKPPPSQDFRKRRSAFTPTIGRFPKPVTLLSEGGNRQLITAKYASDEYDQVDENTAATKSILKNKIPKPKPYLLGENMQFGRNINDTRRPRTPSAVTMINSQLQPDLSSSSLSSENSDTIFNVRPNHWTSKSGSDRKETIEIKKDTNREENKHNIVQMENDLKNVKNDAKNTEIDNEKSLKTRQLRQSDLTYFGIDSNAKNNQPERTKSIKNLFVSSTLVKAASGPTVYVDESSGTPQYQNIPLKTNAVPVPSPRSRIIKHNNSTDTQEKTESGCNTNQRQSRSRQPERTSSNRSISEPSKVTVINKPQNKFYLNENNELIRRRTLSVKKQPNINIVDKHQPTYANLTQSTNVNESVQTSINEGVQTSTDVKTLTTQTQHTMTMATNPDPMKIHNKNGVRKPRTEKLSTPDNWANGGPRSPFRTRQRSPMKTEFYESPYSSPRRSPTVSPPCSPAYSPTRLPTRSPTLSPTRSPTRSRARSPKKSRDIVGKEDSKYYIFKHKDMYESNAKELKSVLKRKDLGEHFIIEDNRNDKTTKRKGVTGENQGEVHKYDATRSYKHEKRKQNSENKMEGNKSSKKSPKRKTCAVESKQDKSPLKIKPIQERKLGSPRPRRRSVSLNDTDIVVIDHIRDASGDNKKSEYIINYDEKNGTMSSICKVKQPSSGISKKKNNVKDKEIFYVTNRQPKKSDKQALLKLPECQCHPDEMIYADAKRKKRMHVHRPCQLL